MIETHGKDTHTVIARCTFRSEREATLNYILVEDDFKAIKEKLGIKLPSSPTGRGLSAFMSALLLPAHAAPGSGLSSAEIDIPPLGLQIQGA